MRATQGRDRTIKVVKAGAGLSVVHAIRGVTGAVEAGARLAALVTSTRATIIGLSVDGVIESWTPRAERLYGSSAAETVRRTIAILALPDSTTASRTPARRRYVRPRARDLGSTSDHHDSPPKYRRR